MQPKCYRSPDIQGRKCSLCPLKCTSWKCLCVSNVLQWKICIHALSQSYLIRKHHFYKTLYATSGGDLLSWISHDHWLFDSFIVGYWISGSNFNFKKPSATDKLSLSCLQFFACVWLDHSWLIPQILQPKKQLLFVAILFLWLPRCLPVTNRVSCPGFKPLKSPAMTCAGNPGIDKDFERKRMTRIEMNAMMNKWIMIYHDGSWWIHWMEHSQHNQHIQHANFQR